MNVTLGLVWYWGSKPTQLARDVVRIARSLPRPRRTLVDLGSGEGRDSIYFARRGYRVVGVDISSVGIRKAERRASRLGVNARFLVGDLRTHRLSHRVGVVFCSGALNNLPRQIRASRFEHFKASTAPGGINAMNADVPKPYIPRQTTESICVSVPVGRAARLLLGLADLGVGAGGVHFRRKRRSASKGDGRGDCAEARSPVALTPLPSRSARRDLLRQRWLGGISRDQVPEWSVVSRSRSSAGSANSPISSTSRFREPSGSLGRAAPPSYLPSTHDPWRPLRARTEQLGHTPGVP